MRVQLVFRHQDTGCKGGCGVGFEHWHCGLCDNRAAIQFGRYEVHGTTGDAHAGVQRLLMRV